MIRYSLRRASTRHLLLLALVFTLAWIASFMPSGGRAALIQKKKPRVAPAADGDLDTTFASAGSPPGVLRCTISDRNTSNNSCQCP